LRALLLALPEGSVAVCARIADALTGALEEADGRVMPVLVERGRERRRASARADLECREMREVRHAPMALIPLS
jgi:hypothetical protein